MFCILTFWIKFKTNKKKNRESTVKKKYTPQWKVNLESVY